MFRFLLKPISWIYRFVMSVRNFLYSSHVFKSVEFNIPVISVGNLTVGGTGKTPHTEYIVNLLKDKFDVTVLSRGYKRKTKGYVEGSEKSTVAEIGDEPKQMAIKFAEPKDIILIAGKGHENYQEINGVKHHFDDKEVIEELWKLMSK